jgi:dienelactone hydrolase
MALVAAAVVLVSMGVGRVDALDATSPISGTVLATTPEVPVPSVMPLGANFAAAAVEGSCPGETRTFQGLSGTQSGVLIPVQADGTYTGELVTGCTYTLTGVSAMCGGTVRLSSGVTVVAPAATSYDFVVALPSPGSMPAEPTAFDVSPGTTLLLADANRPLDLWPCTFNAQRALPTTVFQPTAPGARPLVVVGHGLGGTRFHMQGRGTTLADAGYVVAIPSFPARGSSLASRDLPNQPGDISFVIRELLLRNATAGDALYGRIDPNRIGVSGVSGGAITALLFFNTCCKDANIKAIHAEMGFFLGEPLVTKTLQFKYPIPLLMANNRGDALIPIDNAVAGWEQAKPDRYLVTVPPAACVQSHCVGAVGEQAMVPFFDAYLNGDLAAKQALVTMFSQPSDPAGTQWTFKLQKATGAKGPKPA